MLWDRRRMISTFQALAGVVLALLPGAAYTFAYERVAGPFGITLSDRLVRFLAASAVFHAVLAGPELLLYRHLVATGRLGRGDVNWLLFAVLALGYVVLPTAAGTLVGMGGRRNWRGLRLLAHTPEPRAWDYLWRLGVPGVVRMRLKSGTWLAGVYGTTATGRRSYAAGYPEPGDLYLSLQLRVDPATGEFARDDDDRPVPVPGGSGLLVRWSEIEYLEFQEM
jgi:hypothetical protein